MLLSDIEVGRTDLFSAWGGEYASCEGTFSGGLSNWLITNQPFTVNYGLIKNFDRTFNVES